ncbi:MAG: hypothetical protein PWP44_765 [Thermacetogenium sp.]|nr:hypothetical protein [Thermacetogenium sp.]
MIALLMRPKQETAKQERCTYELKVLLFHFPMGNIGNVIRTG